MQRRIQFTLIELLIVIAIIAILAGMLLPALNAVRAKAFQTSCLGNMRQVSMTMIMYAGDFKEWLPATYTSGTWLKLFIANGYKLTVKSSACPAYKSDVPNNNYYHTLGLNMDILRSKTDDSEVRVRLTDSALKILGARWFLADSASNTNGNWWSTGFQQSFRVNWCSGTSWKTHLRHAGKKQANRAFLDGSAKGQTWKEMRYPPEGAKYSISTLSTYVSTDENSMIIF